MLQKAHLTSHSKISGSRWVWVITPSWLSGLWRYFLYSFSVYSCHLSLISSASVQFSSAQSLSRVQLFATPWMAACHASLSLTNSWSLLKLMPIESVMPSNHLILCYPLLLLPPIPPSIRVFSNESTLRMRWPKYWSFSFSIIPSNEHPGLISFRMDWFGLLAVQGTLKSLLQHHSSKASIFWHSAFFTVQLSHPDMTGPFLRQEAFCRAASGDKMSHLDNYCLGWGLPAWLSNPQCQSCSQWNVPPTG